MVNIATRLDAALRAAAIRIYGVSIGSPADRRTWRIDYQGDPSAADRLAADLIVASLDITTDDPRPVPDPPPVVRPAPVRKIDFLRLLVPSEYAAFVRLAETDDTLRYAQALFQAAPELRLDDPMFVSLLQAVVNAEILTPARAAEILASLTPAKP